MTLGLVMAILAVAALALQAMLIHLLNNRIPSTSIQRDTGERIISQRSFKNINNVRGEFEFYFSSVLRKIKWSTSLYAALTVLIFSLLQGFFYAVPLPPPKPGPLVVPVYVASALLTLLVTSFGWIKILIEYSRTQLIRQTIIDKYVILGVFSPES